MESWEKERKSQFGESFNVCSVVIQTTLGSVRTPACLHNRPKWNCGIYEDCGGIHEVMWSVQQWANRTKDVSCFSETPNHREHRSVIVLISKCYAITIIVCCWCLHWFTISTRNILTPKAGLDFVTQSVRCLKAEDKARVSSFSKEKHRARNQMSNH